MRKTVAKCALVLSVWVLSLLTLPLFWSQVYPAQSTIGAVIRLDETTHTFPSVFEGITLTHTFTVFNDGIADLRIQSVVPS